MKKKYVFITFAITRMGGAQMYINNKIEYLKKRGWDIYVFSAIDGPILLDTLQDYAPFIYHEFRVMPDLLKKTVVHNTVDQIVNQIGNGELIIVESNNPLCSVWGELIARKLGAKHFCFLLDENFNIDDVYTDYFRFKLERRELAFISEKSAMLLIGKTNSIKNGKEYVLKAACNNVVEDITDERFDKIDCNTDYVLCSLGRLTKKYMRNVIDGIAEFLQNTPEITMTCVFIGDEADTSNTGIKNHIINQIKSKNNVSLYMMGSVYPIPLSFLKKVDIGIASSGSAIVLDRYGIKTITMDAIDNEPIGVLGYTTDNFIYRRTEEIIPLPILLHKVLIEGSLKDIPYSPYSYSDIEELMKEHMEYIERSCEVKDYYDTRSFKKKTLKRMLKWGFLSVAGVDHYICLMTKYKKISS